MNPPGAPPMRGRPAARSIDQAPDDGAPTVHHRARPRAGRIDLAGPIRRRARRRERAAVYMDGLAQMRVTGRQHRTGVIGLRAAAAQRVDRRRSRRLEPGYCCGRALELCAPASWMLRSMASIFMSRSFSRCIRCSERATGVLGFRASAARRCSSSSRPGRPDDPQDLLRTFAIWRSPRPRSRSASGCSGPPPPRAGSGRG